MSFASLVITRFRDLRDVLFGTPPSGHAPIYNAGTGKFEVRAIAVGDITGLGTVATLNTGSSSGNVPVLTSGGKLPSSMLPALAITDTFVAASQSAMLALSSAETGDVAVRTDINKTFILRGSNPAVLADWQEMLSPTDSVTSVNGQVGVVYVDAATLWSPYFSESIDVGLAALDAGKAPLVHSHTASQINDSTTAGRALLTAADANAQRASIGLHPESVNLFGQLAQLGRGREFGARQVIVTAYGDGTNNNVAIHRDGSAVSRSTSSTNRNALYTVPTGYVAQVVYMAMSNTTGAGIPSQVIAPGQHRAFTVAANSVGATALADGLGTQGGVTLVNELARSLTPLAAGESIGFENAATGLLTTGAFYVVVVVEIPTSIGKLGTATNFGTRTASAAILYTCPAGKIAYTLGQGPGKSAHATFRVWVTHSSTTILRVYKLDAAETTSAVADNRLVWQYGSANMGNWGGFMPAPITLRAGESIAVDQSAGTATNGARVLMLEVDA